MKKIIILTLTLLLILSFSVSFGAEEFKIATDEEFININIDGSRADKYGIRKANEVNDQMYDYKRANEVYYIPIQSTFNDYDASFFTTKYLSFGMHQGIAYYFIKDRNYFYKNFQKVYYKDVPGLESKVIEIGTLSRNNELFIPAKMLNEVFFFNAYTLENNEILLETTPKQAPDFGFSPEINDYLNREQDMSKLDRTSPNFLEKSEFRYLIKEINSEEDKRILDLEYDLGEYTYDRYLPNDNQWHYGAEELSDEVDNYVISNIGKFRTMDGGGIDFFTESTRGNNGVFLHKLATQSDALRRDMYKLKDEPQDVLGEENIKILQKGDYPTTMIYTGAYYGGSGVNFTVLNPNATKKEGYDNDLRIQWAGFGFENFVYMRAVFKQYFGIEEGERAYQMLVNSYLRGDEYDNLEAFSFKKVYRFGDRNLAIVPNEASRSGGIYFYISRPGNFNYVDYINRYGMKWGY